MRVQNLFPRWMFIAKQKLRSKQRKNVKQKQEEENIRKRINEDIELRNEGVEPLIDVLTLDSIHIIDRYLSPFVFLFVSLFYGFSEIAEKYGINKSELRYYALFASYMIPWSTLVDAFVLNSQELVHGWRLYDYLEYQRHRFCSREKRWTLDSPNFDESITETVQSIDSMSFSSQYYFLVSFLAFGMFINMLGMTILLRSQEYNLLGDPAMPLIITVVLIICKVLQLSIEMLAATKIDYVNWQGIWGATQLEGTMDDIVAAKLAIGEGRQVDLEKERMELEALNDDKFRQRFLDRNRPWILHHLFDLFTSGGSDNRTFLLERATDMYSQLLAARIEPKRLADRADISSDDNDQDNNHLSSWDTLKFEKSSLAMIKLWLKLAKKRQMFGRAVDNQIKNGIHSVCSSCSRNKHLCDSMNSYLAKNGKRDASALDELISRFEKECPSQQQDLTLWKSFFRQNADIVTVCNFCINRHGKNDNKPKSGERLPTRPGDISSDEEEDGNFSTSFLPILVDKDSIFGHLISKWLGAARRKIGGHFPHPDAKRYAERYIAQMKEQKPIKNHTGVQITSVEKRKPKATPFGKVKLDDASKLVMKKWLNEARKKQLQTR